MTLNRSKLLLVLAVIAAVLAVVASEEGEDVLVNAVSWIAIAIGLIAGSFI